MSPKRRRQRPPPAELPIDPPIWEQPLPVIKVVGISGSGKSTLVRSLRAAGYDARPVSQEHSNVPDLWRQFGNPVALIHLHTGLGDQQARRPDVTWSRVAHEDEAARLVHAREHADLRIDTDQLDADEVLSLALHYLTSRKIRHHDKPLPELPGTGGFSKQIPPARHVDD